MCNQCNYMDYLIKYMVCTIAFFCVHSIHGQPTVIHIKAAGYPRFQTPVQVTLNKSLNTRSLYKLYNTKSGKATNVQLIDSLHLFFILPDTLQPDEQAAYKLLPLNGKQIFPVAVLKSTAGIEVRVHNQPLLFYHTAMEKPPSGSPAYYARSGFIHPLFSPKGKVLTDDFPAGHRHQHGIMMAWVNTTFKNTPVDFWNQHLLTGNVMHNELISIQNGMAGCIITTSLKHISQKFGEVLAEKWTMTVYTFSDYFLFDLQSDQTNITQDTLFLNQYHYGEFAFRGSKQWNTDDSLHFKNQWHIQTDSMYNLSNANGKHAAYVNASGKINGESGGATIFGFPQNIRYPQAIRVHPTMPYWGYAPVADGPMMIVPGQTITARFRMYTYDGDPDQQKINQLLTDILHPVEATVQ